MGALGEGSQGSDCGGQLLQAGLQGACPVVRQVLRDGINVLAGPLQSSLTCIASSSMYRIQNFVSHECLCMALYNTLHICISTYRGKQDLHIAPTRYPESSWTCSDPAELFWMMESLCGGFDMRIQLFISPSAAGEQRQHSCSPSSECASSDATDKGADPVRLTSCNQTLSVAFHLDPAIGPCIAGSPAWC